MVLLILGLLPLAIIEAGGFSHIFATVPPKNLTIFAPGNDVLLAWLLAVLPATMVKQTYHLRIFGATSEQVAARGLYNLAMAGCFIGLWAALMGMAIYTINPALKDQEHATVWLIQHLLPPWMMVIVLAAMVAAIAAAADSALHSFSSSFTRDIYQMLLKPDATDRQLRRVSQLSVVAIGFIGIFIAIAVPVVLDALLLGYSITAAGLFFPLIVGRFWKAATHAGAIASIVAGVVFTVLFSIVDELKALMPAVMAGLLASLIALIAVSKLKRTQATALRTVN
jgi:SSS family solute:Na+ symporter